MLYYLFEYLDKTLNIPGAGVFQYITFRAFAAIITSLGIAAIWGKSVIYRLQRLQIGEEIRDLGLEGQMAKKGTPTMGGFIILLSLLIPTLLFSKVTNVYIVLLVTSAIWLGAVGFADDYIKVFKKNKEGLSGKFKVVGQIGLGIIVGLTMYFNQHIKVREFAADGTFVDHKSLLTTVPFMKDNQFDYNMLLPSFIPDEYVWIVYVLVVIFIITAVSNGANITDGIDGLAAGTSVIIGIALAILAYVSGNKVISQYLNVMFIPNSGELAVFCAAFVGACIGFLWYNAYPAQVFMGDTGSLMLGGVIATLAIVIRKEMLIPVLCGIFLIENLSVIIQVAYFKYTKRKYGEGRRVFLMSPLHHHFQKKNYHESKIVIRFLIVGIILAVLSLVTLKLR
ncbi:MULTISPECIES: phospho-N-acetylmuramoyl-pentapeptide-transferase [Aquirufa]|jgi:phospho-N-acetylmuramoyl-pentapeptide-transferase|uniref:Phospho-N-acetylmuramoyl-pentapeptide-transferase n=2 Tax=Aquirufa TaxID=2676247 RepID=A0A4Q9BEA9_9BACT|nr:phospho-N-acetylmuramoyl-pentapeptide-transferase [Aquirufa antheringensis]MCE4217258.1 phospho-N-acetylmuramoyl-pentapeptide-transferase [Pseudarcicella sp. GAP-15]MCZ2478498.1 phospho-N-acetylmuramoyl-pentapeptide-transferase [Aquirufa antheringensis]MCZ2489553.1 phospho-N-acetylmuramoyl-pentapeptide-transferase [Aquirufa antheringensis]TBH72478.1 phospho-N-acetylmuramoyl-pentapeptide-transferase [Aquirufa antheringensis]TBH74286.1 phospho-N-acetylmuramoyl-pentapeptide-transferase [Aquiru